MFVLSPLCLAICLAVVYPSLSLASPVDAEADAPNPDAVKIVGIRQPYRSLSATGATKTDTALVDLPQSARVLTADLLRDAGISRLADALDLGSGIARQSNFGGVWDSYSVRGFTGDPNYGSDFLVNGFSSSRGYNGLRDTANVHHVEILKGPAAALYGRGEPGGMINIATKKPLFNPAYVIEQSVGSYQTRRSALDLTGPLSDTVAYRINAAYEQGNSMRDTLSAERSMVSPSLLWRLSEDTTISYELEQFKQRAHFDRGVLAVNGKLGLIPNSRFLGEQADGPMTIKSTGHQVFLQHEINPGWSLQGGLAYRASSMQGYASEASALQDDGRTLWRQRRYRDFAARDLSGRVELLGNATTGSIKHHLLFGIDGYRFVDDRLQLRKNPSPAAPYSIDIYAPVYGGAQPEALGASIDTGEQQWSTGWYAQDQIELDTNWKALVGVRRDSYRQTITNHNRADLANRQQLDATSPRAGLVYQPIRQVALYASVGKSFRPNSGIGIDNQSFPAESSRAYETGIKFDGANGQLSSTLALYLIKKKNVLTLNPADTNYSIAAGEVGSKGVELDVAGALARQLQLSFSYAHTDAKVLHDSVLAEGGHLADVPKQSASLLLVRELQVAGARASLGAGFNHVGDRVGDVGINNTFILPAYTTFKLVSSYSPVSKLRLSLDVDNLFNKQYYASSYQQTWVTPGDDRRVTFKAQYKF